MAARNDITGDVIATKGASDAYRNNFDAIFRKPAKVEVQELPEPNIVDLAKVERDNQTKRWWAYREQHQCEPKGAITFEQFRDTVLPTLGEGEYAKFLK